MTRIESIPKTKIINYGQESVEKFWLEIPASQAGDQSRNTIGSVKELLQNTDKDSIVCVFTEELASIDLCKTLAETRDKGSRIYILTNEISSEMKNLAGCLIRYGGGKRLGSFVLINPNSSSPMGCFFTGILTDGSLTLPTNLLLELDKEQIEILFRYFCYQFWNNAAKEFIGARELDTDSVPLDIYPPKDNACDFEYLKSTWAKDTQKGQVTIPLLRENCYLNYSSFADSVFVSLFTGIDNTLVDTLSKNRNQIYAVDDVSFLSTVKTQEGVWLIPKIDAQPVDEIYALLLNEQQKSILDEHLIALRQGKTSYQYCNADKRENLHGKTICKLGDDLSKKFTVAEHTTRNLGVLEQTELLLKEQFDSFEPDFPDDGKSVSIKYQWTNRPFTLPKGSVEHPLYKQWETEQNKILAFMDATEKMITENENAGISEKIKHFFTGKRQKFSEYKNELKEYREKNFKTLERVELEKFIARINEISDLVKKDSTEIKEENRRAELEEQIEAIKAEIEEKQKELAGKKIELNETEEAITTLTEKEKQKGGNSDEQEKQEQA